MRYLRFLKPPRILRDKTTNTASVACLVTLVSDLGDSFLPHPVHLAAELLLCTHDAEHVLVWTSVRWASGMRSLPIAVPLPKPHALPSSLLRLRVGIGPGNSPDEYPALAGQDARGLVSAWSAHFTLDDDAPKLVQRRFSLAPHSDMAIWEETGESIARHLWDAGITLACHIPDLADTKSTLAKALLPSTKASPLTVLELGTGCGIVGIALAQTISNANVLLTDLPEAREIVQRNIDQASRAPGAKLSFLELDWNAQLPSELQSNSTSVNLVVAADCTYNPDSSPALVSTLSRLAISNPAIVVAIAMKMRHSSEQVFFHLMAHAGFIETAKLDFLLPGDIDAGEEIVYLHVYSTSMVS
ncbi:hypothetical protein COCMIDRAFT_6130 [Bipolaris oryzae ATCC 44560]|uniref:Methyltransferase small domain-containing protein n=1 Tax=Bipolaris oryzae ATCC 44560 TaxID=930090 RepID=W6Z3I2_COCMI|nr:uncharacterized protein COCMIDRAFT_6130 [Bipolaris oryzae ATCC 44560]EUC44520.1 hypothetical protein COCMIDRAFT_6130 [Bipolaris oryzae ATCC 44560]